MNLTQQRFLGFTKTPFLWKDTLEGLHQFNSVNTKEIQIQEKVADTIRLGNYVERLVSYQLQQNDVINIIKENIQIIEHKTTLGEIDCLLRQNNQPIHLEIAYKFYLYDSSVGNSFREHWIGPNRRDSLVLKLDKIKSKQFPLLYSEACKLMLQELALDATEIQQQTYFKAQLYIPYGEEVHFEELNKDCVCGYYLNLEQLQLFKEAKFHIPKKLDWLIEPHTQVDWKIFKEAKQRILEFHDRKSAPLCWMKKPNGEIDKVFIVWWNF